MFCSKCGQQCNEDSKVCPACGSPLPELPNSAVPVAPGYSAGLNGSASQPTAVPVNQGYGQFNQGVPSPQIINVTAQTPDKNGLGTAGFVLALVGLFTSWVPFAGWIVWLLGAILSFAGMFRQPRGLSIAGFVISFIDLILLLFIFGGLAFVSAMS